MDSNNTSASGGAPSFHMVDIDGDRGSPDYVRSAKWIWASLQTIQSFHQLQATLADLLEHTVVTLQRKHHPLEEDTILKTHPLAAVCREAFQRGVRGGNHAGAAAAPAAGSGGVGATAGMADEGLHYLNAHDVDHRLVCEALEVLTFRNFFNSYNDLTGALTHSEMYSACESRWNVLRCRFRLHRAFNADYEDNHNVVLGGGDVTRAAKHDIRRIGTCVSSTTVVSYMTQRIAEVMGASATTTVPHATVPQPADGSGQHSATPADVLRDAVEAYYGPNRPDSERLLTAEGLNLLPNLAQTSDKRIDVFEKSNPMRPRGDHALLLLKHFLKFQYGEDGTHFAEMILPALSAPSTLKKNEFVELELTVHGLRAGEVNFLADWCHRFDLYRFEPKIRIALRIVLMERVPGKHANDSQSFADVLSRIFKPLWDGLMCPEAHPQLAQFLSILNGVAVAVDDANELQALPLPGTRPPGLYSLAGREGLPPDAYFFFHVWKHTQLFNLAALGKLLRNTNGGTDAIVMDRTLQFRIHSDNKLRSFSHCVAALMVADTIVNPMRITRWSPLGYLFYLTQRHIVLTPSANNAHNAPFTSNKSAIAALIEVGANVSIGSMDPLNHHASDNALQEELLILQKVYHLTSTDVTELCLRSIENANLSVHEIRSVYPNSIRWTSLSSSGVELDVPAHPPSHAQASGSGAVPMTAAGRCLWMLQETGKRLDRHLYHQHRSSHSVPALYNRFPETQCCSVRLAFREQCHDHEIRLLGHTLQLGGVPPPFRSGASRPLEWQIAFPRLCVRGPHVPRPSTAATRLVDVLMRRERYRKLSVGGAEACAIRATSVVAAANDGGPAVASAGVGGVSPPVDFAMRAGVIQEITASDADDGDGPKDRMPAIPTWAEYMADFVTLRRLAHDPEVVMFCTRRLATLEHKFHLHRALMESTEHLPHHHRPVVVASTPTTDANGTKHGVGTNTAKQPLLPSVTNINAAHEFSDFYRCVKVDVHCHMASGMTGKQLLEFMQVKARESPNDIIGVDPSTGRPITLLEVLQRITRARFGPNAAVEDLTVSALDVQASISSTFNRFDQFNNKYNPLGVSELRSLFLKTDNFMGGRYFAELIKQTLDRQLRHRTVFSEFRLSIYGRHRNEWHNLARWWASHGMQHRTNRWMVQVPRIFQVYHKAGAMRSFSELLANVFVPLWEVTLQPGKDPILAAFLETVSGFDSVDNESGAERDACAIAVPPEQWTTAENPPFSYWMYHMWANIASLNRLRQRMHLSTFAFRPHCGESGDPDHLADAFYLADGIGHGVQLKRRTALQYLFYFTQIGLGMTPLSNNALFCRYQENPFSEFFHRGLHVALATDGPLQFHHTDDPLTEEYATAAKFWDLSTVDACEIAANSVRMSGFPVADKKRWLGNLFVLRSIIGNEAARTRVPHSRVAFRYEVYDNECRYLEQRAALVVPHRAMVPAYMEDLVTIDAVGLTRSQVAERRLKGLPIDADVATASKL